MTTTAISQLRDELQTLDAASLRRRLPGPLPAGVVDFCSNDYLGLASSQQITTRAASFPEAHGPSGAGAARLVAGDLALHHRLEARLARFKQAPAALLFSSGYQANVGAISALAGPSDAIYSDALNHASIIDGCRLSGARVNRYRHADPDHLGRLLATAPRLYRRRVIITDAVFGMDGDLAPLAAIADLARKHDALLLVDEAHATGVRGPRGRGLVRELGLEVDLQLTTFGKALGCFGAAVTGSQTIIDYLINRCRTFIFTTALPPAVCTAALASLDLLDSPEGDARRARLQRNIRHLVHGLAQLGLPCADGPIQPLLIGRPTQALTASQRLLRRGYFVQAIRPPTVPEGTSRLRLAVTAAHQRSQIDGLIAALSDILGGRQRLHVTPLFTPLPGTKVSRCQASPSSTSATSGTPSPNISSGSEPRR